MIPIIMVTGFLGAGKTTLLERMTTVYPAGTVYLVNEFSPRDVDGRRLQLKAGNLETVAGGSIFCRCKVTDFINILRKVAAEHPECPALVIEASGIADPGVFPRMLEETELDQKYVLRDIICVVDPGTLPKLLHTLPNVQNQIAVATMIIVNKTDIFPADAIDLARAQASEINPRAELYNAVRCVIKDSVLRHEGKDGSIGRLGGEYAKCADPNYSSATLCLKSAVQWSDIKKTIEENIGCLYRVKGKIPTADGALEIDYAAGNWQETPAELPADGELVIIASGNDAGQLQKLSELTTTNI